MPSKYGVGPNGRALKKDGTERKERRSFTPQETIANFREAENKAFGGIGRKVLAESNLTDFISGLSIFKGWVNECKSLGDSDKREARRAYLQAQIDALDSKGVVAEKFLPKAQDAIDTVNGLYARIGKGFKALADDDNISAESVSDMILDEITPDVRAVVENANNPESDPLADFRRDKVGEDTSEEDDTL